MATETTPLLSYNDWLNQYKNPDYWKYDSMTPPKTFNIGGAQNTGDPWAAYRDPSQKYTKGLADYIQYAMPGIKEDPNYRNLLDPVFHVGGGNAKDQLNERLYGTGRLEDSAQHPLYKDPNVPREVLEAVYPSTSAFLHDDPYIKNLNSKYKYTAPTSAAQFGDIGDDAGNPVLPSNPYGSWDLGNYMELVPKFNMKGYNGAQVDPFFVHSNDFGNPDYFKPYNDDGSFNPDGWQARSTKSQALGHIMGTLGVLAAPLAAYWGPALSGAEAVGGSAGTLGTGESAFFGGTSATAPTVTGGASGAFGQSALDTGSKLTDKALEGAIKGLVLSGGDPTKALTGAVSGGLGSAVNSGINAGMNAISSPISEGAKMFDDYAIPDEWATIGGDSDITKYLSGINTDYNDFGLGGWNPFQNGSDLNLYLGTGEYGDLTGTMLDGISTGDGTYAGAPSGDTSWDNSSGGQSVSPKTTNSILNTLQKLLTNKSGQDGSTNSSGMSPLMMALMMARALKGEAPGVQVSRRASTGVSNSAPSFNASSNRRTLYASGGHIPGLGGGQDDVVNIKAAPGEYVMDAESVSALGDGNTEEGARKLDQMRMNIRKHKRQGGLSQIPPRAKSPDQYLKGRK